MTDEQIMRVAETFGLPLNMTTANFARALLSASIADTAGAKPVAWRYDTQQGFSYHTQQIDHFYTGWDGEYVKGEPLYATPVDAAREKNEIIQALQKALFYWMPSIAGEESPAGQKAEEHAYLLFGLNDNSVECYGDQIRAYVGIMNRQQEKLEIVLRDAGFEDGEDHIEFIEKLASRATSPAISAPPAPSVADAHDAEQLRRLDEYSKKHGFLSVMEAVTFGVSQRPASSVADAAGASEGKEVATAIQIMNSQRFEWITHDHDDRQAREDVRRIVENMSVKSYSAMCRDIDESIKAWVLRENSASRSKCCFCNAWMDGEHENGCSQGKSDAAIAKESGND